MFSLLITITTPVTYMALLDIRLSILHEAPALTFPQWHTRVANVEERLLASFPPQGERQGVIDLLVGMYALAILPQETKAVTDVRAKTYRGAQDVTYNGVIWARMVTKNKVYNDALQKTDLNASERAIADVVSHLLLRVVDNIKVMMEDTEHETAGALLVAPLNQDLPFGLLARAWYDSLKTDKARRDEIKAALKFLPKIIMLQTLYDRIDAVIRLGTNGINGVKPGADNDLLSTTVMLSTIPNDHFWTRCVFQSPNDATDAFANEYPVWINEVSEGLSLIAHHYHLLNPEKYPNLNAERTRQEVRANFIKTSLVDVFHTQIKVVESVRNGDPESRAFTLLSSLRLLFTSPSNGILGTAVREARASPHAYNVVPGSTDPIVSRILLLGILRVISREKANLDPTYTMWVVSLRRMMQRCIRLWTTGDVVEMAPFLMTEECQRYLAMLERQTDIDIEELTRDTETLAVAGAGDKKKKKGRGTRSRAMAGGAEAKPQAEQRAPAPVEVKRDDLLVYRDGDTGPCDGDMMAFLRDECLRYEGARSGWKVNYRVSGNDCRRRLMVIRHNIQRTILDDVEPTPEALAAFMGDDEGRREFLRRVLCDIVAFARHHCGISQVPTIDPSHAHFLYHLSKWARTAPPVEPGPGQMLTLRSDLAGSHRVHLLIRPNERVASTDCNELSDAYDTFQRETLPIILAPFGYAPPANLLRFLEGAVPAETEETRAAWTRLRRLLKQVIGRRIDFYIRHCTVTLEPFIMLHAELYDLAMAIVVAMGI